MIEENNVNETTEVNEEVVAETVEATEAPSTEVKEAPKSKKSTEKDEQRAAGRAKAKAKQEERRARLAEKTLVKKEKLHLTKEEKAERRAAKAAAAEVQTAKAVARYVRMSPMKVNLVMGLIRDKNAEEALAILQYTPKDAASVVAKVLKSAMANAENNLDMDREALYVTEAHVGPGPIIKRFQPRAQGRAFPIFKRTSHVTVIVAERA